MLYHVFLLALIVGVVLVVAAVALGSVMLTIYCVRAEAPMRFYAWVDTKMGGVPGEVSICCAVCVCGVAKGHRSVWL